MKNAAEEIQQDEYRSDENDESKYSKPGMHLLTYLLTYLLTLCVPAIVLSSDFRNSCNSVVKNAVDIKTY